MGSLYIYHLVYIYSHFVAFRVEFLTPETLILDKSVQVGMKKAKTSLGWTLRAQGNC